MSEPVSGFFTGDLFVSNSEGGQVTGVVLRTDAGTLLFRSGIGGRFKFDEHEHLHAVDGRTVYYPYYNETVVELNNPRVGEKSLDLVAEDVSVRYRLTDELYIDSEVEVTAYAPNYIVVDEMVYAIEDPLLVEDGNDYEADEFLGLDSAEGVLSVRNTGSGRVGTVSRGEIDSLVESDEPNGAIQVQNPETPNFVRRLKNTLRDR